MGIVSKSDLFKILIELFGARTKGVRVSFLVDDKPGLIADISRELANADLDIISFGTFMGTDPTNRICTVKVATADSDKVISLLKPHVKAILDVNNV